MHESSFALELIVKRLKGRQEEKTSRSGIYVKMTRMQSLGEVVCVISCNGLEMHLEVLLWKSSSGLVRMVRLKHLGLV